MTSEEKNNLQRFIESNLFILLLIVLQIVIITIITDTTNQDIIPYLLFTFYFVLILILLLLGRKFIVWSSDRMIEVLGLNYEIPMAEDETVEDKYLYPKN